MRERILWLLGWPLRKWRWRRSARLRVEREIARALDSSPSDVQMEGAEQPECNDLAIRMLTGGKR